jgi:hypothetical protein
MGIKTRLPKNEKRRRNQTTNIDLSLRIELLALHNGLITLLRIGRRGRKTLSTHRASYKHIIST